MWILFARAPPPDAPYWPGRRLLACIDAVAWPLFWVGALVHALKATGIVLSVSMAVALLCGLGRLHRAVRANHRYQFTTWRWVRVMLALLIVGAMLKLTTAMTGDFLVGMVNPAVLTRTL